jgi:hypothetical protein
MDENNRQRPGFEQSDVNVIAVGKVGVALLLVTIFFMALLAGLFSYLKTTEGGHAGYIDPSTVFPEPRLERTPIPDLREIRTQEDQTLTSYGWVDQQKGIVRVPISQAMDLVVKQGLPVRSAVPATEQGASVPTLSGLGPKMLPPGGPLGAAK